MLVAAAAATLAVRGAACGGLPQVFSWRDNPAAFHADRLTRGLTYVHVWVRNVMLLMWPRRLCCEWGGDVDLVHSLGTPRVGVRVRVRD